MAQNQSSVRHLLISGRDEGQRVDNFLLRTLKGVPRSHVYRLLRSGQVRVNGGRVKPDRRLKSGDQLRLPPVVVSPPGQILRAPDELVARVQATICQEDEDFLVVNKPPDLPVHGGTGMTYGLIEVLRQARPEDDFLELGHRLDLETSGCLIIARRRPALVALHAALREGLVEKDYSTVLVGLWQGGAREVNVALRKQSEPAGHARVKADDGGRAARSRFIPDTAARLNRKHGLSLMQVRIFTGRTHQIRVHAAHLGFPVAGDDRYGDFETNRKLRSLGLKRMFLHAHALSVKLPGLQRTLQAQVPLPPDLQDFLSRLRT